MKVGRTPVEIEQIKLVLQEERSFYNVFTKDWTDIVLDDLKYKLYGKIPRNFVVNIAGLIGNKSGCFKSTMGLQIALELDPRFTLQQRVAFSINQLLEKVRNYSEYKLCNRCYYNFSKSYSGTWETYPQKKEEKCDNCDNVADNLVLLTKLIFFLDEQTKTLLRGGMVRLQNLVDTCRQRQICFICCGVEQYGLNFTTYSLKRVQESDDKYLPEKRVRYAVYDDERHIYYGYFQWDIMPLTNPRWSIFWKEYSQMKTDFQRVAIAQQTQSGNFEQYAQEIVDTDDFTRCFKEFKNGSRSLDTNLVKNLIYKRYPDLTNNEKEMVFAEVKLIVYGDDET